ncbi:hypothetical protein ACWGDT_30905 [Streptomyces avermitilis]
MGSELDRQSARVEVHALVSVLELQLMGPQGDVLVNGNEPGEELLARYVGVEFGFQGLYRGSRRVPCLAETFQVGTHGALESGECPVDAAAGEADAIRVWSACARTCRACDAAWSY